MNSDGVVPASRLELSGLTKLAPYMIVIGALDGGADFQVRLAGTRVVDEFLGVDPTGAKLSQFLPDDEFGRRSRHIISEAVRTMRPVLNQPGRTRLPSKDFMTLETVTFPLVDDAGSLVKVATLYDYAFEKRSSEA